MKTPRIAALVGLSAGLCTAAHATAEPLDKSKVGADARWVLHFDAEAARECTLGRFFLANVDQFDLRSELAEAQEELGFDPLTTLLDATVYGTGAGKDEAVIVIHATEAVDGALEKLKEKHAKADGDNGEHQEIRLGERLVHAWKEHGSTTYAYFAPAPRGKPRERLVLISGNKGALQGAIDVLDGKLPNLGAPGRKDAAISVSPKEGSILFGAAVDMAEWAADVAVTEVIRKTDTLVVDLGEAAGKVYADADISAHKIEDATNIAQVLQGALAMARIAAPKDEPEVARILELASGLTFGGKGNTITVRFSYDSQKMLELLKATAEHARERDGAKDNDNDKNTDERKPKTTKRKTPPS